MKKVIGAIFLILMIIPCIAQNSYVELDTVTYVGVKIIDQDKRQNALSCQWQRSKNEVVKLTPYEAKSYATGGKVYVAKDITINGKEGRFFVEKMVVGKLALYFVKNEGKHFFIEKDSVFSELTKQGASGKKHYKETLQALCANCDYTGSFLKRTWYSRFYLKRFVQRYNRCEEIYRPVRLGVIGGLDITSYTMLKDVWTFSEKPTSSSFTFGAFVDIPILQSGISLHSEVLYTKQAYRMTENFSNAFENEAIANIESYSIPLLIRYTWWQGKWIPYLNLGMVWYHYSRLESSVLTASIDAKEFAIQQTELLLSPSKYAVMGGGGVWYKISRRNAVFIEARTAYNSDRFTCNVLAGINF